MSRFLPCRVYMYLLFSFSHQLDFSFNDPRLRLNTTFTPHNQKFKNKIQSYLSSWSNEIYFFFIHMSMTTLIPINIWSYVITMWNVTCHTWICELFMFTIQTNLPNSLCIQDFWCCCCCCCWLCILFISMFNLNISTSSGLIRESECLWGVCQFHCLFESNEMGKCGTVATVTNRFLQSVIVHTNTERFIDESFENAQKMSQFKVKIYSWCAISLIKVMFSNKRFQHTYGWCWSAFKWTFGYDQWGFSTFAGWNRSGDVFAKRSIKKHIAMILGDCTRSNTF